jgi:hypothetical protein
MRERVEFRILEKNAAKYLPRGTGQRMGSGVRKVLVDTSDPLFAEIGRLHRAFRAKDKSFFYGREYDRRYTRQELGQAELFQAWPKRVFEPAGEECGTEYNELTACRECGAGATQTSPLRLDLRKVPRSVDFAETIARERIVSQRFAECLTDAGLQGFTLSRVSHMARYEDDPIDLRKVPTGRQILQKAEREGAPYSSWTFWVWVNRAEISPLMNRARTQYVAQKRVKNLRRGKPLPIWYQLLVSSPSVELSPLTRAGEDPFDNTGFGQCSLGHVAGLNLLSEVTVTRASLPDADVMETKQTIGVRRGLLRPRPVLLLSPKAWKAIEAAKIKGVGIEVARIV